MYVTKLNKNGDTIVEVMLALAVLGSVIVGGYSIATRSLNGVRVSQERGEALKIAEAQMEQVRNKISTISNVNTLFSSPSGTLLPAADIEWYGKAPSSLFPGPEFGFCVGKPGGPNDGKSVHINLTNSQKDDLSAHSDDYPDDCKQGIYHVYTNTVHEFVAPPLDASLRYTTYIRWEKAGGGGQETLNVQNRFTVFQK